MQQRIYWRGNRMIHRTAWLFSVPLLAGVVGLGWYFAHEPTNAATPQRPAAPTIPVVAAFAELRDFPIFLTGLGTVQAYNMVTVKARVDGHLDKVAFVEGQTVEEGDLLAQIDPRPLQAQLAQARAAKIRVEAQLTNAKLDLERSKTLVAREFATRQSVDTQRALVAQLEAAVQGDQAAIDSAEVQLGYTTIVSPISGRTGMRLVDRGNIVRASDTNALVVITQVQPISVVFTLPQDVLAEVNEEMSRGPLKVLAHNRGGAILLGEGVLALVDNQIEAATGTIRLKATFANSENALWPGQFVNARLLLRIRREVVTVPAQAVQRGPNGAFTYVIKADQLVEQRPVKVGYTRDGTSLIEEGLKPNDEVVIEGQYKLRAGARVQASRSDRAQEGKGDPSQRNMTQ
jgi:membrane fusion protein, multidrug efflux system